MNNFTMHIILPTLTIRTGPNYESPQTSELLLGDRVRLLENCGEWSRIENERDGYVGYAPTKGLSATLANPTHQVAVVRSPIFGKPDLKSQLLGILSLTARVTVVEEHGNYARLANGGWVYKPHLTSLTDNSTDPVAVAELFLNTPYVWGGCSGEGLDCSGLVQIVLRRCGLSVPRDSGPQERDIGDSVPYNEDNSVLQRGDLVFWRGHVGFYVEGGLLLHANATDMRVTKAPLSEVATHILKTEGSPITSVRRIIL